MPRQANTKEKILDEALVLFAHRGYDRVKMSDIASAVGCAPGALYKHYESKEQVYRAMLERSLVGFKESMKATSQRFIEHQKLQEDLSNMSEDAMVTHALEFFDVAVEFEKAKLFRMLLTVEQFQRPELAQMYDERYVETQYEQSQYMLKRLIAAGIFKDGDTYSMSVSYMAPITVMISVCDRSPQKVEWARSVIENHVRQFYRAYKK